MKYRYETFGGIIASDDPPFLAFVDRQYMRELGLADSPLWSGSHEIGVLTAPTEVHLSVTNRCPSGCGHCYMNAGEADEGELNTDAFKEALSSLADLGVFHVAMGGGEALVREDMFELATHARKVGLVPNLTTSGHGMTPEIAQRMTIFGQVNVSLDAVDMDAGYRGPSHFARADEALTMLLGAGVPTGINCVVGRRNFDALPKLFEYCGTKGVNELELLRLKPAGRGGLTFSQEKTTHEQNKRLAPLLEELGNKWRVTAKIDCSFVPMLVYHRPDKEVLYRLATFGCEAGNILLGGRSNGQISGCSFLERTCLSVFDLKEAWHDSEELKRLRGLASTMVEPCASCHYLDICKGGCHAVSAYVTGDISSPDPDCPWVVEFEESASRAANTPHDGTEGSLHDQR
jgi:radical SAM protein with 4Fe4S-binding SPASM domain